MRRVLVLILALSTVPLVFPGAQLVLNDGLVIEGVDVRREGENYLLELESGEVLTIPVQLVRTVNLSGKPDPITGLTAATPQQLAGDPAQVDVSEPMQLEGDPVRPPTRREQTENIGEPSRFQKGVINPNWHPETDWDMDMQKQNNFAPSRWSENVVDPHWEPESAFSGDDVLQEGNSSFKESIIDNSWTPTDGFKKSS